MAGIDSALAGHISIGLDTSIIIYHFESNEKFLPLTTQILQSVQAGNQFAIVSVLALLEINVKPFRMEQHQIAQSYETLLTNFPNLGIVDVNRDIARKAAQLRAMYNLRPADAIHIATAVLSRATAWISNDRKHKRVSQEITVLLLDDFIKGEEP